MYFIESIHKYYKSLEDLEKRNTSPYISGSKIAELFSNPFDEEYWSTYKAYEKFIGDFHGLDKDDVDSRKQLMRNLRKNVNVRQLNDSVLFTRLNNYLFLTKNNLNEINDIKSKIKLEWKEENKKSLIKGSKYHEEKEKESIDRGWETNPINPFNNKRYKLIEHSKWITDDIKHSFIDLNNLNPGFYAEIVVHWNNYIGTIDKLFVDDNKTIYISDYKTNKELKLSNNFQKMLNPVNHLDDCNYNHYCLQLSFYGWILEKYGYKLNGLMLEHYEEPYNLPYLKKEINNITSYLELDSLLGSN